MLVYLWNEDPVDRIDRIIRVKIGLSNGVLIHFQSLVSVFSTKNAVRAIKPRRWIVVMAQSWTEALASGVNMSRA